VATIDAFRKHLAEHPVRAGLYAFVAVSMTTLGLFAVDSMLRPDRFAVRSVSFEGSFHHVDVNQLSMAVRDAVQNNFFLLDLDLVQARARSVPWVDQVDVRRRWPYGVHVRFTEQQLVARWSSQGWVNVRGDAVALQGAPGPDNLPLFKGPEGMQAEMLGHYQRLSGILAETGLEIATLTLSARHSWSIGLTNGVQLTLGRENPEPKVTRFARVYPLALASEVGRLRRVDLRYTNGLAVEWNHGTGRARTSDRITTGHQEG